MSIRVLPGSIPSNVTRVTILALLVAWPHSQDAQAAPMWSCYGGNSQHTAQSVGASQPLQQILWQTPVDLHPQYNGGSLYIHYGSALITAADNVIIPVKTGVTDSFRVEARRAVDGALVWQKDTDYTHPSAPWTPSYNPVLTPAGRLYMPGAGGTLLYTDGADSGGTPAFTRIAFYGIANYNASPSAFNSDVRICTPLTSDAQGNVFFGYRASGSNPLALQGGIARIGANGVNSYVSASSVTLGAATTMLMNCAPALSNGGETLYVAIRISGLSRGYLVALRASNLSQLAQVLLLDPRTGRQAGLNDDGTASPTVGPDGRVYFGVQENPALSNNDRGWMLQFTSALVPTGSPGAFGWDDTPSIVPASMVPAYHGASATLLMTKYNNYAGLGTGDGVNRLAILDPNASETDPISGTTVMQEVLTIEGATVDSDEIGSYPNAVMEWCINSAVVDRVTHSILAGSEDGRLYRWDTGSNTLSQALTLTPGLGEAYTPTIIGPEGRVYAINNATLFSTGAAPAGVGEPGRAPASATLEPPAPNPFAGDAVLRFSLAVPERATVDIFDAAGRHLARVLDTRLPAGAHAAVWDGRAGGRAAGDGIYFARLRAGASTSVRRLVLAR